MDARSIADFVILDARFPRSLAFCYVALRENLAALARLHGHEGPAHELMRERRPAADRQDRSTRSSSAGCTSSSVEFIRPQPGAWPTPSPSNTASPARVPTMRLAIRHTTRYRFAEPVAHGLQRLRLTPKETQGQTIVDWTMEYTRRARGAGLRRPEPQPRDAGLGRRGRAGRGHRLPRHGRDRGQGRRHRPPCRAPAAVGLPRPDRADPAGPAHPPADRRGRAQRRGHGADAARPLGGDPRAGGLRDRAHRTSTPPPRKRSPPAAGCARTTRRSSSPPRARWRSRRATSAAT